MSTQGQSIASMPFNTDDCDQMDNQRANEDAAELLNKDGWSEADDDESQDESTS